MALKANVGGVWVPVTSVGGGSDEVVVGPDDPIASFPTTELWYDTDEVAILPNDVRWNTAWGCINRISKVTSEAGYNTTEFAITGFYGMSGPTVSGRYTQVSLNLVFSAVTQPASSSYYFIRLRAGSGAAGAILQEFIYPWAVSQQSFGGGSTGYINTMVQTTPLALQAGATFSWTIQCGSAGLAVSCAAGSWASVEDLGPVSGYAPALDPTPAWIPVTAFSGTWVNFGGGQQNLQYRKIGDIVYVRGLVKSGVSGTTVFNLPAGYRPPATVRWPISGALGVAGGLPYASVDTSGNVNAGDMASTGNVSLWFDFSVSA